MTAKRDFKRVVRERMAETGESYTQARQALIKETLSRIETLLTEFSSTEGDRIDREHLIIEAANLAATIQSSVMDGGAFQRVFWLMPADRRLEALQDFLLQEELSSKDIAWAYEQRLIHMAIAVMHDKGHASADVVSAHEAYFYWVQQNLDDASQAQAFCTPEVWWCWDQVGRQDEILKRMKDCLTSIPIQQENKHDRLFLARNLLMYAVRKDDDVKQSQDVLRRIIDEPGDLPKTGDNLDPRLSWEGVLRQTSLIAAQDDPIRALAAAEENAKWIRDQGGAAYQLMGEIAALCMFQGHYELAERYAQEALEAGQGTANAMIYAWCAGGHLGATGDIDSTVPLLAEARRHMSAAEIEQLLDHQEPFAAYSDNEKLRAVVGIHR